MRISEKLFCNRKSKVYDWQKENLLNANGVYTDMMGGCGRCRIVYETVEGERYRANTSLTDPVGDEYTYNSGTMLSGAADLYRTTQDRQYLTDGESLSENSFRVFAKVSNDVENHYSYDIRGFRNWFNGVLLRGYLDFYPVDPSVKPYIESFQRNLDHGYGKFEQGGLLPTDLLNGRGKDKTGKGVEGMFQFTFAAEYAALAQYEYER